MQGVRDSTAGLYVYLLGYYLLLAFTATFSFSRRRRPLAKYPSLRGEDVKRSCTLLSYTSRSGLACTGRWLATTGEVIFWHLRRCSRVTHHIDATERAATGTVRCVHAVQCLELRLTFFPQWALCRCVTLPCTADHRGQIPTRPTTGSAVTTFVISAQHPWISQKGNNTWRFA